MQTAELFDALPGGKLIRQGLIDYDLGQRTIAAYLVSIARTRFGRAGLLPREESNRFADPEHELYQLLRRESGDAYSRYNALLQELVSFEQALDHAVRRANESLSPTAPSS